MNENEAKELLEKATYKERKILNPMETQEGGPQRLEIDLEKVKESLKQGPKRGVDETYEAYKQRMRDTAKALKAIKNGRLVYDSSSMVPFKVQ